MQQQPSGGIASIGPPVCNALYHMVHVLGGGQEGAGQPKTRTRLCAVRLSLNLLSVCLAHPLDAFNRCLRWTRRRGRCSRSANGWTRGAAPRRACMAAPCSASPSPPPSTQVQHLLRARAVSAWRRPARHHQHLRHPLRCDTFSAQPPPQLTQIPKPLDQDGGGVARAGRMLLDVANAARA